MPSVADALRVHAPKYLERFGDQVPRGHRRVLAAIIGCRTGQFGGVQFHCDGCGRDHWVGRSCGNRHCPTCGHTKSQVWLQRQSAKLLPVQYFMVTFTVPEGIRGVLRSAQKQGYDALFDAGAESIRDVGAATRSLKGCKLGYFGALHTWGRDPMVYHPHVHFVVTGGGVKTANDGSRQWQPTPANFLFHHGTLIEVYKAKLADHLRTCQLYDKIPSDTWKAKFVVDIEPVGDGQAVLKYLAPYVNRVAISDKRIVSIDESSVTYSYTPSKSRISKTRSVDGQEFVRGFLQHTLPRGLQKIRYYGWMHPSAKPHMDEVHWLVSLYFGWIYWLASAFAPSANPKTTAARCAHCGEPMRVVAISLESGLVIPSRSETKRAYFDSG